MILVFGSINIDLVTRVVAIARPGETVLAPAYALHFGGKGANQAIAAARIADAGTVRMYGSIGADAFGAQARDNLVANGVDVAGVTEQDLPTGCAFISVDDAGANAITVASGANMRMAVPTVSSEEAARTIVVFQMETPLAESLALAGRIREAGGRIVWNLAPVPVAFTAADARRLLATTHILVVNEHEALAAARTIGAEAAGAEDAGALLARNGALVCIVTMGARGAAAFHPDGRCEIVRAPAIRPLDTTGAGDTFVGILAALLDEGRGLDDALLWACRGASLACLTEGAQQGMPRRETLFAADF